MSMLFAYMAGGDGVGVEVLKCFVKEGQNFYAPPQKVAGYYVIPSELLSVCSSVCPSVRLSVRQRLIIRVRSITLIPYEIIS